MITIVLILLTIPVGVVIALVWYFSSRSKQGGASHGPRDIEVRLAQLESLRSRNLITEAEHEEKRKKILGGL